ncbi:MAG TPA: CNNM domain-containing protein, partial [Micromonosporaceae bacterium]
MTTFLIVVVLLLANAFFVAAEFALISSRRTVIEPQAATSRRAQLALKAMSEIPLTIAGSQLGVTICSLGLGALAEPALAGMLEKPFHALSL